MPHNNLKSANGILIFRRGHPIIRSLQKSAQGPRLHGTQVWQSSYAVMDYLERYPLRQGTRTMEIGCGWGVLGTFCAKRFGAEVLLTDADENVFPYASAHGQLNGVRLRTEQRRFEDISSQLFSGYQVILGSDICFWPDLSRQLQRLILRALAGGVEQILLADPGRRHFMQLADYCQTQLGAQVIPWRLGTKVKTDGQLLVIRNPGGALTAGAADTPKRS